MRILLVEDDRSLSRAVSTILQKNNYSVDCVENGQTALDYLEKDIYDAVIMDIMMPVMDGLTATKAIRALNRPDAGMNAHLSKPIVIDEVIKTILRYVDTSTFGTRNK